jgi:hypothetical protein
MAKVFDDASNKTQTKQVKINIIETVPAPRDMKVFWNSDLSFL